MAESTFTLDNVTTILEGVHKYLEFSSNWLMIPQTELNMIEKRYTLVSQRKKACWEYWLKHHPALSWKAVAITLWNAQEYRSLEVLSSKSYLKCKLLLTFALYITDKQCMHNIIVVVANTAI